MSDPEPQFPFAGTQGFVTTPENLKELEKYIEEYNAWKERQNQQPAPAPAPAQNTSWFGGKSRRSKRSKRSKRTRRTRRR